MLPAALAPAPTHDVPRRRWRVVERAGDVVWPALPIEARRRIVDPRVETIQRRRRRRRRGRLQGTVAWAGKSESVDNVRAAARLARIAVAGDGGPGRCCRAEPGFVQRRRGLLAVAVVPAVVSGDNGDGVGIIRTDMCGQEDNGDGLTSPHRRARSPPWRRDRRSPRG